MKKLFLCLVMVLTATMIFSQDKLRTVDYIILKAFPEKNDELETFKVPEGELWSIESALCELDTRFITLVIDEEPYVVGVYNINERTQPNLPFYLPSGTEFKLGVNGNAGIVSIRVQKIE